MDPYADNYNAEATKDDESCTYTTSKEAQLAEEEFAAAFAGSGNVVTDPGVSTTSLTPSGGATTGTLSTPPVSMTATTYHGAVAPSGAVWFEGWSFLDNIVKGNTTDVDRALTFADTVTIKDDGSGTGTITLKKDTLYILDGLVFVNDGQTLTIEAGTVIKGKGTPTGSDNASALIVAQGGKIMANGTAAAPIIMTAEADNLDGTSTATTRGEWGGLIIIGKAFANLSTGTGSVEGIPTSETRGSYGGTNDDDNSGVINYVSIRHGGSDIGAGNEINGLSLYTVGSGTEIDYVEVVANKDDGIEWFGGTVNVSHFISAYCGDDALDYDEGFRGMQQFGVIYQDPTAGEADRGGEHDGGPSDCEDCTPFANPKFYNITSIGNSESRAITFRDNAGGEYHNSIFINYEKGVDVEFLLETSQDSYKQFQDGNLKVMNNIFFNIEGGAKTTGEDLFTVSAQ